jgi:hypothetical protein
MTLAIDLPEALPGREVSPTFRLDFFSLNTSNAQGLWHVFGFPKSVEWLAAYGGYHVNDHNDKFYACRQSIAVLRRQTGLGTLN